MRILAIDTATKSCSVAVMDGGNLLAEATVITQETHTRHLMRLIHEVVRISNLSIAELDGFAVTRGPGSFTGLRIGISTLKGLATATGKPMVGVSTLDALAHQAGPTSALICTVLDARKKEVYSARYRLTGERMIKDTEARVLPIALAIKDIKGPAFFIGDGALLYRPIIEKILGNDTIRFVPTYHHTIRASTVAILGMVRLSRNDSDDVATFAPLYIRKSDAELSFKKMSVPIKTDK